MTLHANISTLRWPTLLMLSLSLLGCPSAAGDDDDAVDFSPDELPQGLDAPRGPEQATVLWVYDGDTAEMRLDDGFDESIRFLNIDTPETSGDYGPECWASEANDRTEELLPAGQVVWLTWDGELRDGFGRMLCHIFVGEAPTEDDWVNLGLVEDGHATAFIFAANDTYRDLFEQAEADARQQGRGQWSSCP